ncbi:alpha/beta hydrolase [Nonomuraea sp. M3C6]|uniref:Alpha/beta hydrolase n=1 Tax=Nonomuraea marmarensis TaxID=3351344 RepID=A0ABW7AVF7_9ACTN
MARIDVTYDSAGIQIVGHLYLPDDAAPGPRPAIVVGHQGGAVKEQASGLYARRLADKGLVALAYDAAYQGESGGDPRGLEDPAQRVEDFKAAVSFLTTRDEVDHDRIGILGICASGGYSLPATATDHRVKALATVCAVDISRHFRLGADGTQDPAAFDALLDTAAQARTAAAHGEKTPGLQVIPDTLEQARAIGGEYGAEEFEYYRTPRAEHPRSARFFDWSSVDKIAMFDAFAPIPLIGQRPLMMIAGTRAITTWMTIDAFQRAPGPKEFVWIEDASHNDLYDKPQYVGPAVEKLAEFFTKNLGDAA